jgi:hypothetical protein
MGNYKLIYKTGKTVTVSGHELTYSDKHVRIDFLHQRSRLGPRHMQSISETVLVVKSDEIERVEEII